MKANIQSVPSAGRELLVRRGVARLIDGVWQFPIALLLWTTVRESADLHIGWVVGIMALCASCTHVIGESVLVWAFGTTPGKASMRLQVRDRATGTKPSLRSSLLRALKTAFLGMGGWVAPLIPILATWTGAAIFRGTSLPWERGGEATCVVSDSCRLSTTTTAWLLATSVTLAVGAWPSLSLGALDRAADKDRGADISRTVSGQWSWFNPMTGQQLVLRSDWRVVDEWLLVRSRSYEVRFALGSGLENQVRLRFTWRVLNNKLDSCFSSGADLESEGLTVLAVRRGASTEEGCTALGGRVTAQGITRGESYSAPLAGGRAELMVYQHYSAGNVSAREEVRELYQLLALQLKGVSIDERGLKKYFWRSGLTNEAMQIPGNWGPSTSSSASNGELHEFSKTPATTNRKPTRDYVTVRGVRGSRARTGLEEHVLKTWDSGGHIADAPTKSVLANGDILYAGIHKGTDMKVLLRQGQKSAWQVTWGNPNSEKPAETVEQHEVLAGILPTLK